MGSIPGWETKIPKAEWPNKIKQNNNCWLRMWRNWNSYALPVGIENGTAIVENAWQFFRKLNIELLYDQ